MNKTKDIFVTGFALFSMFFGAGNLILPPFLGKNAGETWYLVTLGFFITAVFIPILGILAHARIQGTMFDFGKKVSPLFSTIYCVLMYTIAITLPAPRTASVTHEMAIAPFFSSPTLATSAIYFGLVLVFALNRSKVLNLLGKFLTPLIILILLVVIFIGITSSPETMLPSSFKTPFVDGVLEGYQTFDAIGAVVVGAVLVISLNFKKETTFQQKKELITKAGFIAGLGLLIIYAGLIYNGALFNSTFAENATRIEVLSSISSQTLGSIGTTFLSVLVALACFTTAVGIVTGTADFVKGLFNDSQKAYTTTVVLGCLLGVLLGSFNVAFIIKIALPALMFMYPITIVLIVLNVLSEKYTSPAVFKTVVLVTFLFSIPDFLHFLLPAEHLSGIKSYIPFAANNLGWILPAILSFGIVNVLLLMKNKKSTVN